MAERTEKLQMIYDEVLNESKSNARISIRSKAAIDELLTDSKGKLKLFIR